MSTKPAVNEAAVIACRDAAEFEAWLDAHVDLRAGVWAEGRAEGVGRSVADRRRGGRPRPVLQLDLRPAQVLRQGVVSLQRTDNCQARTQMGPDVQLLR